MHFIIKKYNIIFFSRKYFFFLHLNMISFQRKFYFKVQKIILLINYIILKKMNKNFGVFNIGVITFCTILQIYIKSIKISQKKFK